MGATMTHDLSSRHHNGVLQASREPAAAQCGLAEERLASPSPLQPAGLYLLLTWLSPAYPVGSFAYSSGIEWAVEAGDVHDAESLQAWIDVLLAQGTGYTDSVLFAQTYRASASCDHARLRDIAELASALAPSKERHLETVAQGNAFIEATRRTWPCDAFVDLDRAWDGPIAYPVAVAVASAGHGIPLEAALRCFLQAVVANWVSAGVRLIPLGQSDGLTVVAALEPLVAATASTAVSAMLDDIGSAAFRADLACVHHETQYTRLFRS